jgi:hypothetical protein
MAAASGAAAAAFGALAVLLATQAAHAQLPNFRMALPPDVDPNKKLDTQPGYEK